MRIDRNITVGVVILIGVILSPGFIPHGCALSSSVLACPLTAISVILLPYLAFHQKTRCRFWLLILACPVISLVLSLTYLPWLHSSTFPDWLLDKSALRWKQQISEIKWKIQKEELAEAKKEAQTRTANKAMQDNR